MVVRFNINVDQSIQMDGTIKVVWYPSKSGEWVRYTDHVARIAELEAKLARSDRKEIEAVYRKLGELEATIKRVERLLPFTSLCCQTVVRYAAIKRALGEST